MEAPLVITGDPELGDELVRLCAAAGVAPVVASDATRALTGWGGASVVLVGLDLVEELAAVAPPRRRAAHLLAHGPVPDRAFRHAVSLGLEDVAELPRSEEWLLEVLADAAESEVRAGRVVGLIGGAGGTGTTTFACALGLTAARRSSTVLLDLDAQGPGLDVVLGIDEVSGLQWETLGQTTGRLAARSFREALPRRDGLGVVTWAQGKPRALAPFAVRETLAAAERGHDLVLLDLPRHLDGVTDEMTARCDRLVVVVRGDLPGLSSATRLVHGLRERGPVSCVLRGGGEVDDVQRLLGVPVLARIPQQRGLTEEIDLGRGPLRSRRSGLSRAAADVLDLLTGPRP
ncbi:septum site-determining protein Ssd [Nocardioides daejeonensis]|uniref:septum site-determining protein Ssd n=1 Tax=Nocardioides daejeonensis TaxID=1046556 RepID=UPI000D74CB27|nr:septum site-determining protein Ssd [Nocardioides daejeonensis]